MMKAHIISIGDELLIGQTVNTNASFIGLILSDLGIIVSKQSSIPDTEEDIISELHLTLAKNDIVITTGGLGPTHDDVTRSAIIRFFKTELTLSNEVLERIRERFRMLNRSMSKVNESQALIPKNATIIPNNAGTAPGYWIEDGEKIVIALPGVPFEMENMVQDYVAPKLVEILHEEKIIKRTTLMTTGIAESTLFERLGDMEALLGDAKLAFLPDPYGVKMRITVIGDTVDEVNNKLLEIEQKIRGVAGRHIYGKDNEQLPEVVGRLLKERGLSLSVAESCTGGFISHLITNYAGCSNFFERGLVTYSNAAKVELLKVDEDTLSKNGAVSLEVARQMAEGIKAISGTDIGLSVTGIMGPGGGSEEKPVGTVFIGLCDNNVCTAQKFKFANDRVINKKRTAQAALDFLRRHILGISYDA
ncbi:MAG TPA: competence/damage-inducible protein A [Ignavibacteriaceae bacterium]|nr:competence/damage-inducible protein A [Ignavibacteriaceae bacterium]